MKPPLDDQAAPSEPAGRDAPAGTRPDAAESSPPRDGDTGMAATDPLLHEVAEPRHPRAEGDPIDTPRAFLGDNASFYDENWRWMDWRGSRVSRNRAAVFGFGFWLAYRRMYRLAALQLVWIGLVAAGLAAGVSPWPLLVLHLLLAWQLGRYGNWFYYRHFIGTAQRIYRRHTEPEDRERELRAAGGTDWRGVAALAAVSLLLAVLAFAYVPRVVGDDPAEDTVRALTDGAGSL